MINLNERQLIDLKNAEDRYKDLFDPLYVEEGISMLPFSLKEVDNIEGWKMYSSDALQSRTSEIFKKSKLLSPIHSSLDKMIQDSKILTVYSSKNFFSLMAHKMFGSLSSKSILGFFTPDKNKVYLLMDNVNKILSFMNQKDEISSLTIHELQHYSAFNLKSKFLKMNEGTLQNYYQEFMNSFFRINLSFSDVVKFYTYVFTNIEMKSTFNMSMISSYQKFLKELIDPYYTDKRDMDELLDLYFYGIITYLKDPNKFISEVSSGKPCRYIYDSLYQSYRKIRVRNPQSLVIQETLYPSEVVCIESQNATNKKNYLNITAVS